ncbi:hypothetical protein SEA_GODONK_122 [Gordonia phage GodonK]|uniref:Uncharacterized protein n=1 Tax=Gordonia phage GodonK TaxID=2562192 RepID=A0A4D6E2K6_9CAUD|nr:hypothetical protein HOV33_gp122 [Gordonia phage GodonK]QBZ72741.1 hypothetical protein SEA_GODONK_122 [Gordonia phage GodonK]
MIDQLSTVCDAMPCGDCEHGFMQHLHFEYLRGPSGRRLQVYEPCLFCSCGHVESCGCPDCQKKLM